MTGPAMRIPRVGVGALVRRGNELLLVRRHGSHGAGAAGGDPAVAAADELSEARWFRRDALPEPLFLPFARFIAGEILRS